MDQLDVGFRPAELGVEGMPLRAGPGEVDSVFSKSEWFSKLLPS